MPTRVSLAEEARVLKARDSNVSEQSSSDKFANAASVISHVFQEAQKSTSAHRKLTMKLQHVHERSVAHGYEHQFHLHFQNMINRILSVKKSEPAAEKVVKFIRQYIELITQKDTPQNDEDVDMDADNESESGLGFRFVESLARHLLQGIDSKSKVVRYRVCQLTASIVHSLGEVDDDLFQDIRSAFARRLRDKETSVRVQAVLGLSRLQGTDDEDEPEPIEELLLSALQHDSKAEVRRAVLVNIEKTNETIPYILERARDVDTTTRRAIYSRILTDIGDFRLLSIGMREKILSWGLNDRDDTVRNAAIKIFANGWLQNTGNDILELLERLDVLNSKIAEDSMKALFRYRPEFLKLLNFPDTLWDNLTAESIFLARVFVSYCSDNNEAEMMGDKMPELTRLGFYIERYAKVLNDDENRTTDQEFILEQLLQIATFMDFSDEVGRRKIFTVARDILSKEGCPDVITEKAVIVLREVSIREKDFTQVLSEVISNLHDKTLDEAEESFHSAVSDVNNSEGEGKRSSILHNQGVISDEENVKEIMITLKCLNIAQYLLENVESSLKTNITLVNLLDSLIIPSVRSHQAPIRERGIHCLGLCCLLDKDLAIEHIVLFLHCFNKGHSALKVEALHIVCDILLSHGNALLNANDGIDVTIVTKMFGKGLTAADDYDVQAASAQALAKLLLFDVLPDTEDALLATMTEIYEDVTSLNNQALRQTLSYSLPVLVEHKQKQAELKKNKEDGVEVEIKQDEDVENAETEDGEEHSNDMELMEED
ncbi:nuclear condensing complex subunit [Lipomyces japonicus]|uniref:nuclear condensing complex subunit n=1 Tax=Lipomyces japonicus TaxID=56871 RepID=UPI0034CDF847